MIKKNLLYNYLNYAKEEIITIIILFKIEEVLLFMQCNYIETVIAIGPWFSPLEIGEHSVLSFYIYM